MPEVDILQLGAVAIIFLFCVREFFSYLKSKKTNDRLNGAGLKILKELQLMNQNHLTEICHRIDANNDNLINVIHSDNSKIIEMLARIDGKLSK